MSNSSDSINWYDKILTFYFSREYKIESRKFLDVSQTQNFTPNVTDFGVSETPINETPNETPKFFFANTLNSNNY
jgi:hypothetical protein